MDYFPRSGGMYSTFADYILCARRFDIELIMENTHMQSNNGYWSNITDAISQ